MADAAHVDTDKKIKKLEKNIQEVYTEAQADIEKKLDDFTKNYKVKEAIHQKELDEGKITQAQFDSWKKGQVFQGKQWQAKRDQIISTIHNSNTIATKIINGAAFGVFKNNANYTAYDLEHSNGVNFGFGIYDTSTVTKLLKDNPDLLPKWKIEEQKDYVWNKKKVNNAITQGVIQGERLDQITKRLSTGLASANENTMKTFARTAMTGAQNAGREQRFMTLKAKGINVVKQWMATLDGRTRHSHRMMDGETLPVAKDKWHPVTFSNGCRYPGDPEGPAAEVYNCRCTMVGDVVDFPDEYKRYDNIDGKPIKNMTYQEWYKAKYGKELKAKKVAEKSAAKLTGIDYSKYPGGKEVFDVIKKYNGDWDEFIEESTADDFDVVWNQTKNHIDEAQAWFDIAKDDIKKAEKLEKQTKVGKAVSKAKTKELTEVEKLQAQIDATKGDPFDKMSYSQDRKNNALWPKSPRDADDALRHEAGKVWNNASKAEKDAIYDYTGSYHKFNEPLRGIEYGSEKFLGIGNTDLDADYTHNGRKLNALTDLLDKAELSQDEWFQRGCNWKNMDKFFQCDLDFLKSATQEELEKELLGKSVIEYAFMSCGSSRGKGFSDKSVIMNIYAPQGTKAMYIEPISQYGAELVDHSFGRGIDWDGKKLQNDFGREVETLFQQGTVLRITKVEKKWDGFYVDMEVIDQSIQQRWKP